MFHPVCFSFCLCYLKACMLAFFVSIFFIIISIRFHHSKISRNVSIVMPSLELSPFLLLWQSFEEMKIIEENSIAA